MLPNKLHVPIHRDKHVNPDDVAPSLSKNRCRILREGKKATSS